MRKLVSWILGGILLLVMLTSCGEKACNKEGSVKAEEGILYYCSDRNDGNGLRWYKS